MLEEKRKDLDHEQQRRVVMQLVQKLSESHPDFYYQSSAQIAHLLKNYIDSDAPFLQEAQLFQEERALIKRMSQKDIEVMLSYDMSSPGIGH